jgi:hypothetical protein
MLVTPPLVGSDSTVLTLTHSQCTIDSVSKLCTPNKVGVTLRLSVNLQSIFLGAKPLEDSRPEISSTESLRS